MKPFDRNAYWKYDIGEFKCCNHGSDLDEDDWMLWAPAEFAKMHSSHWFITKIINNFVKIAHSNMSIYITKKK